MGIRSKRCSNPALECTIGGRKDFRVSHPMTFPGYTSNTTPGIGYKMFQAVQVNKPVSHRATKSVSGKTSKRSRKVKVISTPKLPQRSIKSTLKRRRPIKSILKPSSSLHSKRRTRTRVRFQPFLKVIEFV